MPLQIAEEGSKQLDPRLDTLFASCDFDIERFIGNT
jgi:hypothetical protein